MTFANYSNDFIRIERRKSPRRGVWLLYALAAATASLSAHGPAAARTPDSVSISVGIQDLDLSRRADQKVLGVRVAKAAHRACRGMAQDFQHQMLCVHEAQVGARFQVRHAIVQASLPRDTAVLATAR
ncbi:MAG: UrcA family protein [Phenylobacterium sp.]